MAWTKPDRGIRCPKCGAKLAEELSGRLVVTCRRCKAKVEIVLN